MGEKFRVTTRECRTTEEQGVGAVGITRERASDDFTEVAGAQTPEGRAVVHQQARGEENIQAEAVQAKADSGEPPGLEAAHWAATEGSPCQLRVPSWPPVALGSSLPFLQCELWESKQA